MVPWMSGLVSGLQNRVRRFESARNLKRQNALLAQLVEQLTLNQWVQGSTEGVRRKFDKFIVDALLAQLVEQLTLNQWVQGSNP